MSALEAIAIAEGGVITAALMASIGWGIRRAITKGDTRTVRDTAQDTALTLLRRDVDELIEWRRVTAAQRAAMGEEQAVLASWVDRHERWHERHDVTTPPGD